MVPRLSFLRTCVRVVKHFGGPRSYKPKKEPMFFQRKYTSSCSGTESLRSTSVLPLYFTTNSIDGVGMDTRTALTLEYLFDNDRRRCFDNHNSTIGCHDFSSLSRRIFAKVLIIAYQQGVERDRYFRFDPAGIFVSLIEDSVLEVGVPTTQIANDEQGKSIYQDRIVGPFAQMVLSLCLKAVDADPITGDPKMKQCYKEVLDLLYRAQIVGEPWWETLGELLAHPLLQSAEEKLSYLACAHLWMSPPLLKSHGVSAVPISGRFRKVMTPDAFRTALLGNVYYQKDYKFTEVTNGELQVTVSVNTDSWKAYFIKENLFGPNYHFGDAKNEHADMIRHCRVIIFHFEDTNMDAYVAFLDKPTINVAIIHLDRTFSLSLSIFHTLKDRGIKMKSVLDVALW